MATEKVTTEFKFPVGSSVYLKQELNQYIEGLSKDNSKWGVIKPIKFFIIERTLVQCYGGIQNHYHVRGYLKEGGTLMLSFVEIELTDGVEELAEKKEG